MKQANGRLHPHLFGTLVCCDGTALSVLSGGVVVLRVFRDALEHCVAPQNPCESVPRDGSSDQSVGCQEPRGERDKHRVAVLSTVCFESGCLRNPHTSAHVPGVGPGGIGKAQSAKASSVILMLSALVSRRPAAPLKTATTTSTCSSSITARVVRSSFFPTQRFCGKIVVDVERHHCEGFWAAERLSSKRSTRYDTLYHPARFSFKHLVWQDVPDIVKVDGFDFDAMPLACDLLLNSAFVSTSGSWVPVVDAEPFLYK